MSSVELLFSLGSAVSRALTPLEDALATEQTFSQFLRRFGGDVPPSGFQIADVRAALGISNAVAAANALLTQVTRAKEYPPPSTYVDLVDKFAALVGALTAPPTGPPPGIPLDTWTVFRAELWDRLLFDELEANGPGILAALLLAGIAQEDTVDAGGAPGRLPYTKRSISWERLGQLFTDPTAIAREVYDWKAPNAPFRFDVLLIRLARLFPLLDLPTSTVVPTAARLDEYYSPDSTFRADAREIRLTLTDIEGEAGRLEVSLFLLPIPEPTDRGGPPKGLAIGPIVSVTGTQPAGGYWPYSLSLGLEETSRLELLPSGFKARQVPANAVARLESSPDRPPRLLFGSVFSHRVQLNSTALELSIRGPADDPDVTLLFDVLSGTVVVDMTDADGFLRSLVEVDLDAIDFEVAIAWSSKSGFHFRGGGALDVNVPLNLNIAGVLAVDSLGLGVSVTSGDIAVAAGVSGSLTLGPVRASVKGIGVDLSLRPVAAGQPGAVFGEIDVDLGFKAPTGVGIAVNAGPVAGGGFLLFDQDAQRYSGALALRIYEIEVSAFGIIETRLPDGSEGFSFAVLISARFTPIQLGFGFTLNGVGGMLGINRTVETGKLQDAVRSHHLDHVLFPEEPEKNALAILNDLGAFFPAAEGRYVFGPMAIIGWGGAVPVLEAEIGVILELPEPIRLTLLGQVKLGLPSLQKRFVKLNLDVVGVLDFAKKSFSLDASLYDSDLGGFPVAGDMALRLNWGQQPNFALAIGGFHPLYRAPAGFPPLQRVTVNLGLNGNPRVTLSGYLAVTSNTFQVGAKAELLAYKGSFNLYGWVGFDALFVFKPFSFRADFGAGVALRKGTSHWATIHVHGTLSGTNPWHVQGNACLSLFFFDICIGFDVPLSKKLPEPIEPLPNILQLLADELRSLKSWNAELPLAAHQLVTLAANQSPQGNPVLDPLGAASVKQRLLPLDQKIDRFEHQKLKKTDPKTFRITKMTLRPDAGAGAKELTTFPAVADHFARGQFQDLSDAAKLSLPAFELMTAGAKLAADEMATGGVIPFKNEYETILIEPDADVTDTNVYTPAPALVAKFSRRSASALGGLGASGPEKFFAGIGTLARTSLGAEGFTIATVAGLDARDNLLTAVRERIGFVTKGKAREVLEEHLAAHPEQRGQLQVLPAIELPEAA
jgi:hypothetical protein